MMQKFFPQRSILEPKKRLGGDHRRCSSGIPKAHRFKPTDRSRSIDRPQIPIMQRCFASIGGSGTKISAVLSGSFCRTAAAGRGGGRPGHGGCSRRAFRGGGGGGVDVSVSRVALASVFVRRTSGSSFAVVNRRSFAVDSESGRPSPPVPPAPADAGVAVARSLPEAFRMATLYSDDRIYKLLRFPRSSMEDGVGLWTRCFPSSSSSAS